MPQHETFLDFMPKRKKELTKPFPKLLADLASYWSRRIEQEHRLVYKIEESKISVLACRITQHNGALCNIARIYGLFPGLGSRP